MESTNKTYPHVHGVDVVFVQLFVVNEGLAVFLVADLCILSSTLVFLVFLFHEGHYNPPFAVLRCLCCPCLP